MTLMQVPVTQICAGLNDRTVFTELPILAANIAVNGLAQPPVYRSHPTQAGMYQIVLGERRTRAMRDILGWTEITADVRDLTDEQALALMGSENRCRVQLNPMDEAAGYAAVMNQFGWTVQDTAAKMGASVNVVRDRLLLLALCEEVADLVKRGIISVSYGQAIGRAGLDRNWQNMAADALSRNPAPTLAWFGSVLDELAGKQNAPDSMFDLALFTVDTLATVQAVAEPDPPQPGVDTAPVVGTDAETIIGGQVAYWEAAALAWERRGGKPQARECRATARSLQAVLTGILALRPAPVPVAPVPVTLFEAIRLIVGPEVALQGVGDTVNMSGITAAEADYLRGQVERFGYRAMIGRADSTYRVIVSQPAPLPAPRPARRQAAIVWGAQQAAFA
jgi:ParB/RepB/Spo0J family partition protein